MQTWGILMLVLNNTFSRNILIVIVLWCNLSLNIVLAFSFNQEVFAMVEKKDSSKDEDCMSKHDQLIILQNFSCKVNSFITMLTNILVWSKKGSDFMTTLCFNKFTDMKPTCKYYPNKATMEALTQIKSSTSQNKKFLN